MTYLKIQYVNFRNAFRGNPSLIMQTQVLHDLFHTSTDCTQIAQQLQNIKAELDHQITNWHHKIAECESLTPNEIFSAFLQNCVYYITHNIADRTKAATLLVTILKEFPTDFYYKNPHNEIILWVDAKELCTAIESTCRENFADVADMLITMLQQSCGGTNTQSFRQALLIESKNNFPLLNTICKTGCLQTFHTLINAAKTAYAEEPANFISFLTRPSDDDFSPLHTACTAGHTNMGVELLQLLRERCRENLDLFSTAIQHKDAWGFTSLNTACHMGHLPIIKTLIATAKELYQNNQAKLMLFLTKPNERGFSPLHNACKTGNLEIVQELLHTLQEACQENPNALWSALTHHDKSGCTPLHAACYIGNVDIVNTLIGIATCIVKPSDDRWHEFIDSRNQDRTTPLFAAIGACKKAPAQDADYQSIAQTLVQYEADIYNQRGRALFKIMPPSWPEHIFKTRKRLASDDVTSANKRYKKDTKTTTFFAEPTDESSHSSHHTQHSTKPTSWYEERWEPSSSHTHSLYGCR